MLELSNNEKFYFNEFNSSSLSYSKLFIKFGLLKDSPRYLLELISLGAFFSIIIILLFSSSGGISKILPIISVFAYSGIRILPAFQKLYQYYISMKFNNIALISLKNDILKSNQKQVKRKYELIVPKKNIILKDINYIYPKSRIITLKDINLEIKANTTVGIVGSTGSGKSTLLDIITGLLDPSKGEILIDDIPLLKKNKTSWKNSIGYVSQEIFIADDTIRKNIALGTNDEKIDTARIEIAAKQANIYDFINNQLPKGFYTKLGERGIRVSGGQRQRIGIARALYMNPSVLLLDEATSALDNLTEKSILKSFENVSGKKTIIMIAHRLSTIKNCDNIFFLEGGKLVAQGTYGQLMKIKEFRKFAEG